MRSIQSLSLKFFILWMASLASPLWAQGDAPSEERTQNITVAKVESPFSAQISSDLATAYRSAQGSRAVIERLERLSNSPEELRALAQLVNGGTPLSIELKVHTNEREAIEWVNGRMRRMGTPFQFKPDFTEDDSLNRAHTPDHEIRKMKLLRYLAAPGIALGFTAYNIMKTYLNGGATDMAASDFLVLILPTAAAGVTTIALEYQFAHPWMNSHIWTPLWKKGGAIGGRLINITVNTLYGLSLYAAGKIGSFIPKLWGDEAVAFQLPEVPSLFGWAPGSEWLYTLPEVPFIFAVSFIGGLFFHFAMGQFQTDIAIEERGRRSMTNKERYTEETQGVVVNNGARVTAAVAPNALGFDVSGAAFAGWFAFKTLPRLIKTHFLHRFQDWRIRTKIKSACAKGLAEAPNTP